ncbi:TolC family protein [Opitutus sp. ER46]|uniref:TolC family protein n=1 Tax=Opitutus sp. ER46 TaxID=2161864 RepID=UPI000D32465C|nr:TolC family protein [Opitutus sp. ER46]PTX97959.1 hypothetical protein DB354_06730 [Opitutus sp. ER46]
MPASDTFPPRLPPSRRPSCVRADEPSAAPATVGVRLAGILLLAAVLPLVAAPAPLPLSDALVLARAHNRQVQNAALAVEIAGDRAAAARSYRYPQLQAYGIGSHLLSPLDFHFPQGAFGVYNYLGPVPATDTVIRSPRESLLAGVALLTQPVSQQYKVGLKVRQAEIGRKVDAERLRAQQQATDLQVKRTYHGIVQTQGAVLAAEAAVEFAREFERITRQAVTERAALPGDLLEVQARLADAEARAAQARDALVTQREQLNVLLGRDLATEFTVVPVTEVPAAPSLANARRQALAHRPELQQARLGVRYAELTRREKRAEYIPDVNLVVSHVRANTSDVLPSEVTSAGVMAQWDVFDWGRRGREVAIAKKALRQADNLANDTEARVLVEVGAKYRQLEETRLALRSADLQLAAEQEKLRVALNAFQQNFALRKDLLQQQAAAEAAQSRRQQALLAVLTAQAELENAIGQD